MSKRGWLWGSLSGFMGATVGVYMDKESLIGRRKEERDEHIPRRCLLVYGVASKAELMRRDPLNRRGH